MELSVGNEAPAAQLRALRRHNSSLILGELSRRGPLPRADLSERLGISPGTVTKITNVMIESGLLHALPKAVGSIESGRPRIPLDFDPEGRVLIGVQIGLRRTNLVATDLRGRELRARSSDHAQAPGDALIHVAKDIRNLARAVGRGRIMAVGVSMPGWVDHATGVLVDSPLLGWRNIPVRAILTRETRLPVEFDSTPRAVACAELWMGVGRECSTILSLFVGNLVGAALVVDRQVVRGATSQMGNVTHLPVQGARGIPCQCGRRDCLQAVASQLAVLAQVRDLGLVDDHADIGSVWALDDIGDREVGRILNRRAGYVAAGLQTLREFTDPELIVLSGLTSRDNDRVGAAFGVEAGGEQARAMPQTALVRPALVANASAALGLDAFIRDPVRFEPHLSRTRGA